MKNGQRVAQLAIAWETDEVLSPEQHLFLAEQTYGYTIVHEFEYAGQRFQIRKIVEHKDAQKERVIFGVHAQDGTAHIRIDGQLSRENFFTMEYGKNYKLELRETPIKLSVVCGRGSS